MLTCSVCSAWGMTLSWGFITILDRSTFWHFFSCFLPPCFYICARIQTVKCTSGVNSMRLRSGFFCICLHRPCSNLGCGLAGNQGLVHVFCLGCALRVLETIFVLRVLEGREFTSWLDPEGFFDWGVWVFSRVHSDMCTLYRCYKRCYKKGVWIYPGCMKIFFASFAEGSFEGLNSHACTGFWQEGFGVLFSWFSARALLLCHLLLSNSYAYTRVAKNVDALVFLSDTTLVWRLY